MRILFTTPILEHPAAGGPQLRIENSIKALSKVCEVDIINRCFVSSEASETTNEYFRKFATEYHVLPSFNSDGFLFRWLLLAERVLNRFFDMRAAKQAEYILGHVDRRQIDIIWFGYGNISYRLIKCIKTQRPNLKVVCDTDSVWSRFVLRELPYATGLRKFLIGYKGQRKEAEERAWVKLCEVTTAVSEVDAEYYNGITEDSSRIQLFSNVIDIDNYKHHPPPPVGFNSPSIYLAGTFGHYYSPMDTAARWILAEVLPRVLETYPNVHFYIVGSNSDLGFGHLNDPNITVTGRLDTVLPYLCNTDVAIVPLKFESGTRFKILEAGACKIPLVSTTLGAEGIPVVNGEHILIADDPEDFANAIVRLLDDKSLARELALNCHHLVIEKYSVESLAIEAKQILEYLSRDSAHH
jgi:polysaccharide biosynthesis protein PslH